MTNSKYYLNKTIFAVSYDETRYVLNGLLLKIEDSKIGPYKQLAYLLRAILVDHPFSDGNKRTDYVAVSNTIIGVVLLFAGFIGTLSSSIGLNGINDGTNDNGVPPDTEIVANI